MKYKSILLQGSGDSVDVLARGVANALCNRMARTGTYVMCSSLRSARVCLEKASCFPAVMIVQIGPASHEYSSLPKGPIYIFLSAHRGEDVPDDILFMYGGETMDTATVLKQWDAGYVAAAFRSPVMHYSELAREAAAHVESPIRKAAREIDAMRLKEAEAEAEAEMVAPLIGGVPYVESAAFKATAPVIPEETQNLVDTPESDPCVLTDEEMAALLPPAIGGSALSFSERVKALGKRFETDPHGKDQHATGAKLDNGKNRLGLVLGGFANALLAVGEVGTFGAAKYTDNGWKDVPDARSRYTDAKLRHALAIMAGESHDPETKLSHAAHEAWNALAILELEIIAARESEA